MSKLASQADIDAVNELIGAPEVMPGHRFCLGCLKQKPVNEFHEDSKACLPCSESLEIKELAERKEKKLDDLAAVAEKMIHATAKNSLNVPHVTEYVQEIIEQLGGVKELVRRRLGALQNAEQDDGGSARVMRGYEQLEKLIVSSTEHLDSAPDIDKMSREELSQQLAYLLMSDADLIESTLAPSPDEPEESDDADAD